MKAAWYVALSAILMALTSSPAHADAATHLLRLSAYNFDGQCVMTGTLTNLRGPSTKIQIAFVYSPTRTEEPEAQMTMLFQELATGVSDTTTDHAPFRCSQITLSKVEVVCPDERDRCPGFYYIQIPELKAPRLAAQKVEGR
jgi:hypothetical protein